MSHPEYPDDYLRGIILFNRGDFFEAHEAWEDVWNATPGPPRNFYKGLIQAAVALCHYYNGNVRGATRLHASSSAILRPFAPRTLGLDVEGFVAQMDRCFEPLAGVPVESPIPLPSQLVPIIELDPPPADWPDVAEEEAAR